MRRLLDAFRLTPSPVNRTKVQAHLDRHPMAVCILGEDEIAFLRTHEFKV